tara:strand:- start:341 stop:514 length:174 start_codon:yes stop_codon:yes gene_type:complete
MIDKDQLNLIFQIIGGIEDLSMRLEDATQRQDRETFEKAKKEIIQLQSRLAGELSRK